MDQGEPFALLIIDPQVRTPRARPSGRTGDDTPGTGAEAFHQTALRLTPTPPTIPPKVDFHGGGSLAVPGADADAARIAAYIHANRDRIASIHVTLDTHQVRCCIGSHCASNRDPVSGSDPMRNVRGH